MRWDSGPSEVLGEGLSLTGGPLRSLKPEGACAGTGPTVLWAGAGGSCKRSQGSQASPPLADVPPHLPPPAAALQPAAQHPPPVTSLCTPPTPSRGPLLGWGSLGTGLAFSRQSPDE